MKTGIWKLGDIKRGMDKGTCPPWLGNECAKNTLLSYRETRTWNRVSMQIV
jgi:hypothetical protein